MYGTGSRNKNWGSELVGVGGDDADRQHDAGHGDHLPPHLELFEVVLVQQEQERWRVEPLERFFQANSIGREKGTERERGTVLEQLKL